MEACRRRGKEQIDAQTPQGGAGEVTKLVLTNSALPLPDLFKPVIFHNLTHLCLECMQPPLTSLEPLRGFVTLKRLVISSNRVKEMPAAAENGDAFVLPNLTQFIAPGNSFSNIDTIKQIGVAFPKLNVLDLAQNPVENDKVFKETAFGNIRELCVLNDHNREGEEMEVLSDSDSDDDAYEEDEYEESSESDSSDGEEEPVHAAGGSSHKRTRDENETTP